MLEYGPMLHVSYYAQIYAGKTCQGLPPKKKKIEGIAEWQKVGKQGRDDCINSSV